MTTEPPLNFNSGRGNPASSGLGTSSPPLVGCSGC